MALPIYVGLDLETSGTDIDKGALPIQLGMALGARLQFCSYIGWPQSVLLKGWNEDSAKVHGITMENLFYRGSSAEVVAKEAAEWLSKFSSGGPRDFIAVGWNVGTFDFPFVRRYMPELDNMFKHRFMDLNSVCFSLAQAGRRRAYKPEYALGFEAWKKRAKKAAEEMMGGEPRWHDAVYDALAGLFAWYWMCDRLEPREGVIL